MSLTLIPSNLGLQRGFAGTVETGINIESYKLTVTPEIDDYLEGPDGQAICNAVGDPKGDLDISGEYRSVAGIIAASFIAAFVPTNNTSFWGRTQGGFYLKSGDYEIGRSAWRKVSCKFASRFNIP